ncbi:MFS transporter permease [Microbacterium testaceum]|uniref:MFS transporter permease n=2 Tax=Microbacterium testaceum TaxID=2033 RepID=A0A2T7WRR7_MICTE|nr:MFS transporter permease [Microbacterium testaceum]
MMRTTAPGRLVRSRQSLIAAVTGTAVVVLVALGLFLPLAGLLIGVTASSAGLVPFPGLSVTAVTLVGIVVVAALLLFAVTRRRPASAWAAAVFAVLVSLAVTAFPVIAVAAGSAERVSDVGPLLGDLWQRFTGGS